MAIINENLRLLIVLGATVAVAAPCKRSARVYQLVSATAKSAENGYLEAGMHATP
jgi:hypothetical protein